ncbi:WD repeat-containing protein-like protein 89 [Amylocarpus encephaloides]|uniref:WD repeat-containing protein-like protein 89 n=1 Tax=Amylocarpus encephaloides TaxID=45428 RepID=A0A9P7YPF9_9HELO|nr:WD repeat-containing protein-like protein 89 [Amylocarpus encephaloides]
MYLLNETCSFKVSDPPGTYIYDLLPTSTGLATISSDDTLRLLDPLTLTQIKEVKEQGRDYTCLKAVQAIQNVGQINVVAIAGRDGGVSLVDVRTWMKVGSVQTEGKAPILSLACTGSETGGVLAVGTELVNVARVGDQASVLMWDMRNLGQAVVSYVESHSDDVTELQFHPLHPQILLSGSTDGLLNIYNTTSPTEEDALHQTINHGHSIHHAGFLNEREVFALSHDEKFSVYEQDDGRGEGGEPRHFGDLREGLGGEYVADVVVRGGGSTVLGVGSHSQASFDLIQLKKTPPWTFAPETKNTLRGGHGSEIVRAFCFLDEHQTVLTAGEDGQVKAWRS